MKNLYDYKTKLSFLTIILIIIMSPFIYANSLVTIEGQILDNSNNQILGATVLLMDNNKIVSGTASDDSGRFQFSYQSKNTLTIKVQALGFSTSVIVLKNKKNIIIKLKEAIIEIAPISVITSTQKSIETEVISQKQFEQRSKNSIITNNPINALKQPQMLKQGSALSSKLRINGTSPSYYFHNSPIGYDPNHYGMFSVIPSSVVSSVIFYPNGSPAEYQLPAIIDLLPKNNFDNDLPKTIEFSFVQSTATYSYGQNNFYVIGSLRKSVLDKLVRYLDVESNRRTIPPTNFEDIVVSSGFKLSNKSRLYIDQFYTRDYLAYNTGATTQNKYGLNTFQHTKTSFVGLSYQYTGNNSLFNAKLSNKNQTEEFEATPPFENLKGLDLHLAEISNQYNGKFVYTRYFSNIDITNGFEFSYTPKRTTELRQINWNHKSPDATSNNPFVYQYEMNHLYSKLALSDKDYNSSFFSQMVYENKRIKFDIGLRYENFAHINENSIVLFRHRITYKYDNKSNLSFFAGTFAESPIKNILENYQVLTRVYQTNLSPQKTQLLSLSYQKNDFGISFFSKKIKQIATPHIDYSKVTTKKQVTDGFITMKSSGSLEFIGGDISFDKKKFISHKLDLYTFYGYTKAKKESDGYNSSYELNAPHKFLAEFTYQHSTKFSFGTEFNYHSGFAYTPYLEQYHYTKDERYKKSYYEYIQSFENSQEFPAYYNLNIFVNFKFSGKELNFSLSNLTNRANPVVHTSDGYIYDPSMMPSVAFYWNL